MNRLLIDLSDKEIRNIIIRRFKEWDKFKNEYDKKKIEMETSKELYFTGKLKSS